jgi:hypothetical protein
MKLGQYLTHSSRHFTWMYFLDPIQMHGSINLLVEGDAKTVSYKQIRQLHDEQLSNGIFFRFDAVFVS